MAFLRECLFKVREQGGEAGVRGHARHEADHHTRQATPQWHPLATGSATTSGRCDRLAAYSKDRRP